MSLLYINENGTIIGVEGNRFTVRYKDGMVKSIPVETLESITVLGIVQIKNCYCKVEESVGDTASLCKKYRDKY